MRRNVNLVSPFLIALLLVVFFVSCQRKRVEPSEMKFLRFEQLIFSDEARKDMYATLKPHREDFRYMFSMPIEDTSYVQQITEFVSDTVLRRIVDTVNQYYGDMRFFEKPYREVLYRIQQQFPSFRPAFTYTFISGDLDFFNRVLVDDSFVAIAIDMYTLSHFAKDSYFGLPKYLVDVLSKEEILPNTVESIGYFLLDDKQKSYRLLDRMLAAGKVLYMMDVVMPKTKDFLKIRYSQDQYNWCVENEGLIWSYLLDRELLYEKDFFKYRHLMNEGPTTQVFPSSPSRLGEFIGWQIIKRYMQKQKLSLQELFQKQDAQEILSVSGYKPKRS